MQMLILMILGLLLGACAAETAYKGVIVKTPAGIVTEPYWQKICDPSTCVYSSSSQDVDDDRIWITVYVQNLAGENTLRIFTPVGVFLSRGIGLKAPKKDLRSVPYVHCQTFACYVQMHLTDENIKDLDTEESSLFVLAPNTKLTYGLPVSFKGLRAMLDDVAPK